MKKLYEILRDKTNLKNCKLLAPIIFLIYYPMRKEYVLTDIEKYGEVSLLSERQKARLSRKIIWNKIVYRFETDEFFYYHLENLSWKEKKKYIADYDRVELAWKMNDNPEKRHVLDNKMEAYKVFGKYYGRDVCFVPHSDEGRKKLADFSKKHPKFIAKTLDGSFGDGTAVFDMNDYSSVEDLCLTVFLSYSRDFLVEELVIQSEELAELNSSSVNTVRIHTFRFDDRIEIKWPYLRIGRKDSVVDNAAAGGVMAFLDEESGEIYYAADELGVSHTTHPDSGVQLVGFKMPYWEEVKAFSIELAQVVPENRYVGWDIAVTDNGPVMIEGNAQAQFVMQIAGKGLKDELDEIMKEMGI